MQKRAWKLIGIVLAGCGLWASVAIVRANGRAAAVATGASEIGGAVACAKGPEAGVWVIAETSDLGTKFRKIVVTDDRGQFLLPELPKANYKVWVRGYGLVDSEPVDATRGKTLALAAVVAPTPAAAAQYYPASYWASLLNVPPKSAFPMTIPGPSPSVVATQADWLYVLKGCWGCHQTGTKATREIPASLGKFDSSAQAWARFISSGQLGSLMNGMLSGMGHEQGVTLFADWGDRIAKGDLPPVPSRPEGAERNVVVTVWDWSVRAAFPYAAISTDKRNPSVNAYGPVYGGDWFAGGVAAPCRRPARHERVAGRCRHPPHRRHPHGRRGAGVRRQARRRFDRLHAIAVRRRRRRARGGRRGGTRHDTHPGAAAAGCLLGAGTDLHRCGA